MTTPHKIRFASYLKVVLLWVVPAFFFSLALPVKWREAPVSRVLEARDGQLLGARVATDGQWRFPAGGEIPDKIAVCVRLFEDEWFYLHPGINPVSTCKAFFHNLRARRVVRGGSTLPMQLVRMQRGQRARTYGEKLIEWHAAMRLVLQMPRQEILSRYLAEAPYGGNVVGLEAASWRYFGKSPEVLSWTEAATLAVLPNAPALIYPGRRRDQLLQKRNRLLEKLHRRHFLSYESLQLALAEPLPEKPYPLPDEAPELLTTLSQAGDGRMRTTLLAGLQRQVRRHMTRHHALLRERGIHNMAALILDNHTGEVIAYAGNTPSFMDIPGGQVDIIRSRRSPGSTLKPLLYAWAMQDGLIGPSSLLSDIPSQYGSYRPENYYRQFRGVIPAREAIASSLNVPMVRLLRQYGVGRFLMRLRQLGFTSLTRNAEYYGLPLILGGGEVSLWELTQVYGQLARTLNRYRDEDSRYHTDDVTAFKVLSVESPGEVPGTWHSNAQTLRAGVIWAMLEAMRLPDRPEEAAHYETFSSSRLIGWKTGTSFGYKDAWCVGVTPEFTLGVWIGNADGEPRAGLTGIQVAAPLLFDLLDLLPATSWFEPPYDDLQRIAVCVQSGYPAGPYCTVDSLWTPRGPTRPLKCSFHHQVWLLSHQDIRVHAGCADLAMARRVGWFVLPPVEGYYYQKFMPGYRPLPPLHPDCAAEQTNALMQWVFPPLEADLAVPAISGKEQSIVFSVVHERAEAELFWYVDELFLGSTKGDHRRQVSPAPGVHSLTVVDERGNRLQRNIRVLE